MLSQLAGTNVGEPPRLSVERSSTASPFEPPNGDTTGGPVC